jgi:hypothetical protein
MTFDFRLTYHPVRELDKNAVMPRPVARLLRRFRVNPLITLAILWAFDLFHLGYQSHKNEERDLACQWSLIP